LPDTCDIYRTVRTDDAYGGETDDEDVIQTGVKCALESGAAQEQIMLLSDRIRGTQTFTVFLPAGTDVKPEDHLIIISQSNLHLRVQAVMEPESWEIERRVIASEEGEHSA
jgi:hypothetical protein